MENKKNIFEKLFEVKKAWIKLKRDTQGYWYNYATLNQIQEKLWEVMEKQWLLVTHRVFENQVITSIINVEAPEEQVESSIIMNENTKPQDKGSEITYYRRYNLLSLLDLETEDDDGKKAQESWKKEVKKTDNQIKKWYNDVDKNIDDWYDMVSDGKITPEAIIKRIKEQWFSLSKVNENKILELKK